MRVWEDVGLRPLQINYKTLIFFLSYVILSTSQLMSQERKLFETGREEERKSAKDLPVANSLSKKERHYLHVSGWRVPASQLQWRHSISR